MIFLSISQVKDFVEQVLQCFGSWSEDTKECMEVQFDGPKLSLKICILLSQKN